MTAAVGHAGLWLAAISALWAVLSCAGAAIRGPVWLGPCRIGLAGAAAGLLIATGALVWALIGADLSLTYVAAHVSRSLPVALRTAAFWSGEEGSLLLWATLVGIVGAGIAVARRRIAGKGEPLTLAVLGLFGLFLTCLVLFGANPFGVSLPAPADGHGLHPQLRHWAMIAHPPIVFMGYSASLAPFAILCGALASGRRDTVWVAQLRRWALACWLCLGVGIVLGAWWAYVELGWGGYWAWDPVENAALLPWLTATALLHTIIVHQHRGSLKGWTAGLAAGTFVLSVLGAALTRSGLVQSVHAFTGSATGLLLAGCAGTGAVASTVFLVSRRHLLTPDVRIERVVTREGASLLAGILLVVMATATLIGTLFPLSTHLFGSVSMSIAPAFYTRTVAPLGIALVALMSIGPFMAYGRAGFAFGPGAIKLLAAGATMAALLGLTAGFSSPTVLLCIAIAALTILAGAADLVRTIRSFARTSGYGLAQAAARVIDGHHRRYGGQLAHAGIALLVVGVAGSSLLKASTVVGLRPGQTMSIGHRTLRLDGLTQRRFDDFTAVEAGLSDVDSPRTVLHPQRRFYDDFGDAAPRIALASGWREDLYISLVGWDAGGEKATFEVKLNPLTLWIWAGAALAAAGGLFSLLPRLLPRPANAEPAPSIFRERRASPAPAVQARGLCKDIDGRAVLADINLDLPAGSCTAVLGPNGAGKSTLLRTLATLIRPSGGTLSLFGSDPSAPSTRARIGFVGHELMLYRDLTVLDNLVLFARLYGVPDPHRRARELLGVFGLRDRAGDPVHSLSRGLAQRAALARAVVHSPDLLLADEPFTGLDRASSQWLVEHLSALREQGTTIVLSHHDSDLVLRLASRVLVLHGGRIAHDIDAAAVDPDRLAAAMETPP